MPVAESEVAQGGCAVQQLRTRTQIQLAFAEPRPSNTMALIKQLVDAKCGVVTVLFEHTILAIKHGNEALALKSIDLANQQCRLPGRCYAIQAKQFKDLTAIVHKDKAALTKLAENWLAILKEDGPVGAIEHELVWVLANTLNTLPNFRLAAIALLVALDDHIGFRRSSILVGGTEGSLANLARYDDLRKMRLLVEAQSTNAINLNNMESMRSQRLEQKLRRARWAQELAGVEDQAAKKEFTLAQQQVSQSRKLLRSVEKNEIFRIFQPELLAMLEATEDINQDRYFAKLADKHAGSRSRPGWEWSPLTHKEDLRRQFESVLAVDEAYLSWLRCRSSDLI